MTTANLTALLFYAALIFSSWCRGLDCPFRGNECVFEEMPSRCAPQSPHRINISASKSPRSRKSTISLFASMALINSFQSDPLNPSEPADRPIGGLFEIYGAFKPILTSFKQVNPSSGYQACQTLLQDCTSQKDRIIAWFASEKQSLGPAPTLSPNFRSSCAHLPATDEVFGPAYQFPSLESARLHVLYWTALCLIYPMIYQAKMHTMTRAGRAEAVDPRTDQDYMLSWYYADEACRGVPYCLTNTEQIWGAQGVMFSIAQASQIYSNIGWEEKFMWCQRAFTAIEYLGFGLAVCLRGAALKYWLGSGNSQVVPTATLSLRDRPQKRQVPGMGERTGEILEIIEPPPGDH